MKRCISSSLAVIVAFATTVGTRSQTGPAGGVDLSGKWTLDSYLTDHPQQIAAAIQIDLGQGRAEQFASVDDSASGRGGSRGQDGTPRNQGRSPRPQTPNLEEQNRLNELTASVRYPPTTLTISQTPTTITFADEQGRTRTFTTNGKREKQTLTTATLESTTRFEGPQLVSEHDLEKGRKMTLTYSIVPTTKQLIVRVVLERAPNQPGPFEVRHVYNRETGQ